MLPISKPRVRTQQQNIYTAENQIKFTLFWNRYSDRVATFSSIENPYNWENGFCTYLGFATKAVAIAWQQHLLKLGVATSAEYRKVNRLKVDKPKNCAIRWELKVRGLTYRQLLHLLTFDLTQAPPRLGRRATAHDFEVCDRVKIINTYGGAEDSRIGLLGTVESRDVRTNTLEVRVDSQKVGTLLLKPEWAVRVDAVKFPNCCELPEPQLQQSEVVEVQQVDPQTEVAAAETAVETETAPTVPGLVVITTRNNYHHAPYAYFIDGWQMPSKNWQPGTDEELMDKAAHRENAWNWKKDLTIYKGRRVVYLELPKAEVQQVEAAAEVSDRGIQQSLAVEMPTFEVGDRVEVTSNRHGNELVGVIGIVSATSKVGCAVNVKGQLRWFCNDEFHLLEKAPQPREAKDDLLPPVKQEYTTLQLPLNYNAAPVGRRGATANWKARQASGRGVNLTADDGLEKWKRIEQEQKLAVALAALPDDDDDGLPF